MITQKVKKTKKVANKETDATMYQQLDEQMFAVMKNKETNKFTLLVGKYKVSNKEFASIDEANEYVNSKPYELIVNVSCLICKLTNEEKKQENEKKN